jgi:hypothetical protein
LVDQFEIIRPSFFVLIIGGFISRSIQPGAGSSEVSLTAFDVIRNEYPVPAESDVIAITGFASFATCG